MDRCHICDERSVPTNCVVMDGRIYPLCPVHVLQVADYLVTMLQGWLHDRPKAGQ
jgi:hypothetical protein